MSIESIDLHLTSVAPTDKPRMSRARIEQTISAAALSACVTVVDVKGPRRFARLVAVRRAVTFELRAYGISYPEIARALGRKHPTAYHLTNPAGYTRT